VQPRTAVHEAAQVERKLTLGELADKAPPHPMAVVSGSQQAVTASIDGAFIGATLAHDPGRVAPMGRLTA
jgi:hypothetical protein